MALKNKKNKKSPLKRAVKRSAASEVTRLGSALRALGALGGGAVGGVFGMPAAGSGIGHSLGASLSRWLGSGDYSVANNSIVRQSMKASSAIPMMHNDGQSVVIRHKEYLGELGGTAAFAVQDSYQLNPGNNRTFPWLSRIASQFQEYQFKGLVFHYVPTSGNAVAGASAPLGSVMMQTSYRATDMAPGSKVEMLNEYCSNECVPSEAFAHPIECDPKENPFNVMYVRSGTVPPGDNIMMYDLGVTHVATSGQAATTIVGDLWVTYEVVLKKPMLYSNVTSSGRRFEGRWSGGTMVSANVFNGALSRDGNVDLTASGTTITFPEGSTGRWLVAAAVYPTTVFTTTTVSAPTASNAVPAFWNIPSARLGDASAVGAASSLAPFIYIGSVLILDPQVIATYTLNFTLTGAATTTALTVTRIGEY